MTMGAGDSLLAEIWALLRGTQLAWQHGICHLLVEADSRMAVKLELEGCEANRPISALIEHTRNLRTRVAVYHSALPKRNGFFSGFDKFSSFLLLEQEQVLLHSHRVIGSFRLFEEKMGSEDDSIEQAAASRRERLLALKAAQELLNTPDDGSDQVVDTTNEDNETTEEQNPMKFRNYVPHDKHLQEGKLAPAVLPKFEDPVAAAPPPEKEDPFLNIAPKKPNWDLRRDVQKKLDKLERRTQKALYKLMEEQEKQNLLTEGNDTNGSAD